MASDSNGYTLVSRHGRRNCMRAWNRPRPNSFAVWNHRLEEAVTCTYRFRDLIGVLHTEAPAIAEALAIGHRRVDQGLLSVGLKIHCLDDGQQFDRLVAALGGATKVLEVNHYKDARASLCLVLPPVGNAVSAVHLVEGLERFIGSPIFGNRNIQLQLCSPGRLSARGTALLGIGFYLGSDTLRRYTQADLRTTFESHVINPRGIRLVLYDADGDFDRDFAWWNKNGVLEPELPFENGRTDLLIGSGSRLDIQNVNLLATLLIHSEYDGYWRSLGEQFKLDFISLLTRHILAGLLDAPWVRESWAQIGDDDRFFAALDELVAYAYGESARVKQRRFLLFDTWRDIPARAPNGILEETQSLLSKYRTLVERQSHFVN